jgi:hypothetical protein
LQAYYVQIVNEQNTTIQAVPCENLYGDDDALKFKLEGYMCPNLSEDDKIELQGLYGEQNIVQRAAFELRIGICSKANKHTGNPVSCLDDAEFLDNIGFIGL